MPKFYSSILLIMVFINFCSYGQKKTLQAKSTVESITIDGKNNEEAWKTAPIATDFVMFEPDNGKPISDTKKTEVKILYDNTSIYVLAILHDDEPNKISKELTNRDVFGISDHFSVSINGYNDGQQDFRFYVSSAGVQMDCLAIEDSEDYSWDAIWKSEVTLTDFGWVVEMKIPYAALRFSKAEKQTWGLNFKRVIKRDAQDQSYTWNYVDTKIGAIITQEGILEGIEKIKTPTRLFFIPYTSAYYQQNEMGSDKTLKGGMDIKYGINDAFTLDAILVPDFGQTKFDNAILNLEPFEQQLNENRPFFTEATDLFAKGGMFYSRRIGGEPIIEPETKINEVVTDYPSTVDLINAVKVSGRTEKGMGIGVLNAVTEKTYATIRDTITNVSRKEVIEPLVNYNVLVLDQRFNQNSSVSFVNTNTVRNGNFRDANASALLFDLNTKANTYNLYGDFKYSYINDVEDYDGYKTAINFAKTSGKFRYLFTAKYLSKNYDINDLGIIFVNNYHSVYAETSYRIVNPTKVFNSFKISQNINFDRQNTTGKNQEAWYQINSTATTLKNHYLEFRFTLNPLDRFDFYEPRVYEKYVYVPKSIVGYAQFYSNDNRPFHYEIELSTEKFDEENRNIYRVFGGTKYRFNDKLSLSYNFEYTRMTNDRGWVDFDNDDIIFAERNRENVQHYFTGKYSVTNRMNFNLIARYYWSYSDNHEFFTLQDDGYLKPNPIYSENKNRNFNSWNLDFSYSWWFAPGSELSVLYRNYALESTNLVEKNAQDNFSNLFDNSLTNIFSISLRYYIDYNSLKSKR
ncbi:MAG: carbohydrate binding family 9 domain-containing protein [Flavobacterium sp.]|nr:carbohydrate binding family 9 domain-containing protein [Flavobacterium sp.]